jgi:hypothetical protein
MRKSAVLVLVAAVVVAGGIGWRTWHAEVATASTTSTTTTTTTVPVTMGAVDRPRPVCVRVCSAWRPMDPWQFGAPSVMTTTFVPFVGAPSDVAYAAWVRTSSTILALYPGYKGPGPTNLPRGAEMVPLSGRSRLLATFNSGFYEADSAAGFYANHTLYFPMVAGLATVVRYTNGKVDVVRWTGGARPGPTILMARQNLALLVSNERATTRTQNNALWGLTLHGLAAVWRTALGVDSRGNLVYAAAPDQTAAGMAAVMVKLHVVRAMQLDINPEWPIFVSYGAAGAQTPSLFVPNPNQVPGRFLYSSTKDFFAVFVSRRPGEAQPW